MLLIQFGRKIIHQINALASFCFAYQMPLGNAKCAHHQLLLPSGQGFRRVMAPYTQAQVGSLRSGLCVTHGSVPLERRSKHVGQITILIPTAVVAQLKIAQIQKLAQGAFENRLEVLNIRSSEAIYLVARQGQLTAPRRVGSGVKCTMPQQRVPLTERLLQALPGREETRFHVEHAPVHELPTQLWRAFK